MASVINSTYNQTVSLNNQFQYYAQRFEGIVLRFQHKMNSYDFTKVLLGNVCADSQLVRPSQQSACLQL